MEKCDKAGRAYSSQISQMYLKYLDMDQHVQIANSEGCYMEDHRMKTRLFIEAVVRDDQDVQRSYYGPGAMGGYEFLKQINVEECARKVAQNAIRCLGARACRQEECQSLLLMDSEDYSSMRPAVILWKRLLFLTMEVNFQEN